MELEFFRLRMRRRSNMNFPPEFLDDIRAKVRVSEIVSKRIRLVKRGREFLGLCPFHDDTKPSLSVVDEKNFYHCFACGAHGDIITFMMGTEGLSFPEAVEKLATIASLEIPIQTPGDYTQRVQNNTLREALEYACKIYEKTLWNDSSSEGIRYLEGRGLSHETIRRFRLGYTTNNPSTLLAKMKPAGFDVELLLKAGLVRKYESKDEYYDYFRGRVIFPITDRQGRVIAFGGRALRDVNPKYLNSPDSPLFFKGRVLYGLAQARESASKTEEVILAEGYMDVIALSQAGFPNSVAPLGTALTEQQIQELWKLAREPIICFDGDTAGGRAAFRAAEKALPILKPGFSLRFAILPSGEDPDDLIKKGGSKSMRDLISLSVGLSDFIWENEKGLAELNTPERHADFFQRIRSKVQQIADKLVQEAYLDAIEQKIREFRRKTRMVGGWLEGGPRKGQKNSIGARQGGPRISAVARARVTEVFALRQQQSIIAAFIAQPSLTEEFGEALAYVKLDDAFLDKLRRDILDKIMAAPDLDTAELKRQLFDQGYSLDLEGILGPNALKHASFARPEASFEHARAGVRELLARIGKHQLEEQLFAAQQAANIELNETNWKRLASIRAALEAVNNGSSADDVF